MKSFFLGHPLNFFFSSFKIRNFLEIGTIYFWKFMESFFFFHHSSSFKKKKNKFFFWWVDSATHGVLIGGGGEIWAPFLCHHHFYFFSTSSSSLSLLAPLPLFTSFFLLHFLHFYTISCLENHFSRLPNFIFSISQNIFSNPWVLDHLCETHFLKFIFFWNSSLHLHGISSWTNFSYFQWEEISSIPRMERWRGAPSRPKHPCSTLIQKGFQVSLFFCFFCW